jgi:beta-glucosidase
LGHIRSDAGPGWDLPQALEDRGGWTVGETAERFADYANTVYARLR